MHESPGTRQILTRWIATILLQILIARMGDGRCSRRSLEADDQEGPHEDTPRPGYRTTKVVGMVISPESDELHAGPEDALVRGRTPACSRANTEHVRARAPVLPVHASELDIDGGARGGRCRALPRREALAEHDPDERGGTESGCNGPLSSSATRLLRSDSGTKSTRSAPRWANQPQSRSSRSCCGWLSAIG